jgi:hypothetical protein
MSFSESEHFKLNICNSSLKDATVKKLFYKSHKNLQNHLKTFIDAYNYVRPLKVLGAPPYEKLSLYLLSEVDGFLFNPTYKFLKPYTYR